MWEPDEVKRVAWLLVAIGTAEEKAAARRTQQELAAI